MLKLEINVFYFEKVKRIKRCSLPTAMAIGCAVFNEHKTQGEDEPYRFTLSYESQSPCKLDRIPSVFQLRVFIDRQRPWSTVIPEFVACLRSSRFSSYVVPEAFDTPSTYSGQGPPQARSLATSLHTSFSLALSIFLSPLLLSLSLSLTRSLALCVSPDPGLSFLLSLCIRYLPASRFSRLTLFVSETLLLHLVPEPSSRTRHCVPP